MLMIYARFSVLSHYNLDIGNSRFFMCSIICQIILKFHTCFIVGPTHELSKKYLRNIKKNMNAKYVVFQLIVSLKYI